MRAGMRKHFWSVTRELNSDCQIQRLVYERHPGSCGLLRLFLNLLSLTTGQFWAPGNFELVVLAQSHEQRE